ncbi:MAG TPA: choice-of-anchor Q domain-containing protein, partial [Lacipirellulaceae bacterium]|nr:choice-of-anchor Q domain-containing protein [Lacipirellulaceae bacterium]
DVIIINSTIANNRANQGGGIYSETGSGAAPVVEIHNSIVSENFKVDQTTPSDIGGNNVLGASSHNLIGTGGSGGLTHNSNGNIVLSGSQSARLAPLHFYGGPTRTHALYYDSPAVDAGDNLVAEAYDLVFDQRGKSRFVDYDYDSDDRVDIGAVELALGEIWE